MLRLLEGHPAVRASHDDTTPEHVAEARACGCTIAEFPTTLEAAEAARASGMGIVMGAPNLVIGGSHSGNVSAAELVEHGLLDVFSSDYVPASLLHAAFLLHEGFGIPLPEAIAPVTRTPAALLGLDRPWPHRARPARRSRPGPRGRARRRPWSRSGASGDRERIGLTAAESRRTAAAQHGPAAALSSKPSVLRMSTETGTDSDYGLLDTRYAIYFAPPPGSPLKQLRATPGSAATPTATSGCRSRWSRASRRSGCTRSPRRRATTASMPP